VTRLPEKVKKQLFVVAGTASLAIGIVGIFVPVLPTTPFLLLAAFCYFRSSKRLYDALLSNRFIGGYITNYLEGRGMSFKMKVWTIALLWIAIVCSALFTTDNLIARIVLAAVLVGVTTHIVLIKTIRKKQASKKVAV